MRDRDRKLISKIQQALERIAAGTFGMCANCGEPIGAARLRARPVTELCIECKREAEQRERA
jgi:DnaK suppressor protein